MPNIRISIVKMPRLKGIHYLESFGRRIGEDYIVPQDNIDDPFVREEGLHPCTVVPKYCIGKELIVLSKRNLIRDGNIVEEISGSKQICIKRYLIPKKSKTYYSETDYIPDGSPSGLYPTLIMQDGLIGKKVIIIDTPCSRNAFL